MILMPQICDVIANEIVCKEHNESESIITDVCTSIHMHYSRSICMIRTSSVASLSAQRSISHFTWNSSGSFISCWKHPKKIIKFLMVILYYCMNNLGNTSPMTNSTNKEQCNMTLTNSTNKEQCNMTR